MILIKASIIEIFFYYLRNINLSLTKMKNNSDQSKIEFNIIDDDYYNDDLTSKIESINSKQYFEQIN